MKGNGHEPKKERDSASLLSPLFFAFAVSPQCCRANIQMRSCSEEAPEGRGKSGGDRKGGAERSRGEGHARKVHVPPLCLHFSVFFPLETADLDQGREKAFIAAVFCEHARYSKKMADFCAREDDCTIAPRDADDCNIRKPMTNLPPRLRAYSRRSAFCPRFFDDKLCTRVQNVRARLHAEYGAEKRKIGAVLGRFPGVGRARQSHAIPLFAPPPATAACAIVRRE